jgi:hypothetical protein
MLKLVQRVPLVYSALFSSMENSPPPASPDLADYRWLTSADAQPWLAFAADPDRPLHHRAAKLRQSLSPVQVHLVLNQAELRARAVEKFDSGEELFLTSTGLEQATDQWIAAHKARRFPREVPVADLCCGIGGDLIALVSRGPTDGIDIDPTTALLAEANLRAQRTASPWRLFCTPAEKVDLRRYAAWHIDPDRRAGGTRTVDPQYMSPGPRAIERLLATNANASIKLAPATQPPDAWRDRAEWEWISRGRECRQVVAWFGSLAQKPGLRRATVLDGSGIVRGRVEGLAKPLPRPVDAIQQYLYEPDPAVLAAGLAGSIAERHAVAPLSADVPYFTSANLIQDPVWGAYRIEAVLPFDNKRLAAELRARHVGVLEVKCRGLKIAPEELRRRMRLRGDGRATVIISPHGGRAVAILVERIQSTERDQRTHEKG